MFEEKTFDNIIDRMLESVTKDVDKSEGSLIYSALAPAAIELSEMYIQLDNVLDMAFSDTASGEWLDKIVADFGLIRKPEVYAVRKVTATGNLEIGSRFAINVATYEIIEPISNYDYKARCEQPGTIGNAYSGELEPIDFIGEVTATLGEIITEGIERENDDTLRTRLLIQVRNPSTSGNVNDYLKWALNVNGVGKVKVKPLWNGNGTVKVIVVDSDCLISPSLPNTVLEYIETVRPIGATVTVVSPTPKNITVSAKVTLVYDKTLDEVKKAFKEAVKAYLKGTVFKESYISFAKIGSILLTTDGVIDYTNLKVNNGTINISIGDEEIPIASVVELEITP